MGAAQGRRLGEDEELGVGEKEEVSVLEFREREGGGMDPEMTDSSSLSTFSL